MGDVRKVSKSEANRNKTQIQKGVNELKTSGKKWGNVIVMQTCYARQRGLSPSSPPPPTQPLN